MVIRRVSEWLKELIKGKTYHKPFISVHRNSSYSLHIIPKQKIHVYYVQPVTSFNTLKQNGRHTSARPCAQFHISESIWQECLSNAALGRSTSTSSRSDLALGHCKTICLPHQSEAHFVFHLCSSVCRNTWSAHIGFIHSAKLKIKPILLVSGPFI